MKKISLLFGILVCLSLCGCQNKDEPTAEKPAETSVVVSETHITTSVTEQVTEPETKPSETTTAATTTTVVTEAVPPITNVYTEIPKETEVSIVTSIVYITFPPAVETTTVTTTVTEPVTEDTFVISEEPFETDEEFVTTVATAPANTETVTDVIVPDGNKANIPLGEVYIGTIPVSLEETSELELIQTTGATIIPFFVGDTVWQMYITDSGNFITLDEEEFQWFVSLKYATDVSVLSGMAYLGMPIGEFTMLTGISVLSEQVILYNDTETLTLFFADGVLDAVLYKRI